MTHLEIGLVFAGLLCFSAGVWAGLSVRRLRLNTEDKNRSPGILWQVPRERVQHVTMVELANAWHFHRDHAPETVDDTPSFDRVTFWLAAMHAEEKLRPWSETLAEAARNAKLLAPETQKLSDEVPISQLLSARAWRKIASIELERTLQYARQESKAGQFNAGSFLYVQNWMTTLDEVAEAQGGNPKLRKTPSDIA
jgi:hypothetical protein